MLKYRIIGVLIGIAIGSLFFLIPVASRTPRYTLLSEGQGKIDTVVIQYNSDLDTIAYKPIKAFLSALDRSVNIVFVCSTPDDMQIAKEKYKQFNIQLYAINKAITGWSKDRFLTATGANPYILSPRLENNGIPGRTNDASVPAFLANNVFPRCKNVQLDIAFDAGDILCSGKKTIVSNVLEEKNRSIKLLPDYLSSTFSGDIVLLRNVPKHHIGMFAAPLSDDVAVVGDVGLASAIAHRLFPDAVCSPSTAKLFDNAADQLRQSGYTVYRVPTIVFDEKTFITYTNGIFEKGRVFMPVYGIPELDQVAQSTYEKLGLTVVPIPVGELYKLHGTIGCLVNVVKRRF